MASKENRLTTEQLKAINQTIVRLRAAVMSVAFGLAGGTGLFLITIWLVLRGPAPGQTEVGPTLRLLNNYFPGYEVTVLGSFVGFFYGTIVGALLGWFIAFVYNTVANKRQEEAANSK